MILFYDVVFRFGTYEYIVKYLPIITDDILLVDPEVEVVRLLNMTPFLTLDPCLIFIPCLNSPPCQTSISSLTSLPHTDPLPKLPSTQVPPLVSCLVPIGCGVATNALALLLQVLGPRQCTFLQHPSLEGVGLPQVRYHGSQST